MNYFLDNWGSIASVAGVVVSLLGLWAALVAVKRAGKARESADAAQKATVETRAAMTRVLTVVDLQRAIALIQRLKDLHRDSKWQASLEHYQPLRAMLADIDSRLPTLSAELRSDIRIAIPQIVVIENNVDEAVRGSIQPSGLSSFNEVLNEIQVNLVNLASSTFTVEGEEDR